MISDLLLDDVLCPTKAQAVVHEDSKADEGVVDSLEDLLAACTLGVHLRTHQQQE